MSLRSSRNVAGQRCGLYQHEGPGEGFAAAGVLGRGHAIYHAGEDHSEAAIKRMDTLVGLREMPAEFANHVSDFVAGVTPVAPIVTSFESTAPTLHSLLARQLDRRTRQSDSNFSGERRRGGEAKTGDGDEVLQRSFRALSFWFLAAAFAERLKEGGSL